MSSLVFVGSVVNVVSVAYVVDVASDASADNVSCVFSNACGISVSKSCLMLLLLIMIVF